MWQERIEINPKILAGKPVIKGTRLAVEFILELLGNGWSITQILENYPGITQEDIDACFAYTSYLLKQEKIYPILQTA